MKTASDFMQPEDIKTPLAVMTERIERELVDGRPRLVMYFDGHPKGLLLTKRLVEEFSAGLGRNKMVDDFFATEGQEH
jgi:hypothetical protein